MLFQLVRKPVTRFVRRSFRFENMSTSGHSFQPPGFFLGSGQPISKSVFYEKIAGTKASVIMVGENHEDPLAHALELEILKKFKSSSSTSLGLSLEFYDREAQTVLDEFLEGLVPLDTFLSDSRPPANHEDYQPLLDLCKAEHLPVLAANCPRRYTRMVSKAGGDCLTPLANTRASCLLPSLPYDGASEKYKEKFIQIMQAMGNTNPTVPTTMLDAQSLWDATMADTIHQALGKVDRILHVTGYFHIQYKLGTVEHLMRLTPGTEILTVVILPAEDTKEMSEEQKNIADLVVLTDVETL